jgi:CheY-like chemotaxis protein
MTAGRFVVMCCLNKQADAELGFSGELPTERHAEVGVGIVRRSHAHRGATEPAGHPSAPGARELRVRMERHVVAVVDDDPGLLESLEDLLESAGYTARLFPSAGSLLANGLTGLDLIITDIGMPGIDGFELRDRVKQARPELPVFLITGRHETADQNRAQGISELFRKPFDGQALLAAIDNALRH